MLPKGLINILASGLSDVVSNGLIIVVASWLITTKRLVNTVAKGLITEFLFTRGTLTIVLSD